MGGLVLPAQVTTRLHERLHKLPGMPPHSDAARLNHNAGARRLPVRNHYVRPPAPSGTRPALTNRTSHHTRPPRVLAGWQEWTFDRAGALSREC
jgi:hypothetical protein